MQLVKNRLTYAAFTLPYCFWLAVIYLYSITATMLNSGVSSVSRIWGGFLFCFLVSFFFFGKGTLPALQFFYVYVGLLFQNLLHTRFKFYCKIYHFPLRTPLTNTCIDPSDLDSLIQMCIVPFLCQFPEAFFLYISPEILPFLLGCLL